MKSIKILAASFLLPLGIMFTACDNDGDIIYTSGSDDLTIAGDTKDIVLSADALDALVLTLYWNDNGKLTTSDDRVDAPANMTQNIIELASDPEFVNKTDIAIEKGIYEYQFTCRDLNATLTKLGFTPGEAAPLYIRIRGTLADNIPSKYSDVLTVNVVPYKIDTTIGFYLNAAKEDTGKSLYSPEDNHVYSGFIGAGAWENWWLKEGDGTLWGNDGETGTPFVISSKSTAWNFWYPGISGSYYTVVNTLKSEWTALLIESLTVSGDLAGDMTFDRKANQWSLHATGKGGNATITIAGSGKQYNATTGTDDAAAVSHTVSFGGDAAALSFNPDGSSASITLAVPNGEFDLILDLNDPKAWTVYAGTAAAPVEKPAELLWVVGHNDGITGGWNFDSWLRLYNEDSQNYGGVLNINSLWGYKLYKEVDNWDDCWSMVDGGNGFEGKLEKNGPNNIWAPDPGLYVADVSLTGLTYKLTAIQSVSYTGLNDDWSLSPMTATDQPGVYTATVTKSANTPWGVKVVINENWDIAFGGGSGYLRLYQDGFDGDNELANGPYTLTVNLLEGTYSYK